MTIRYTHTNIVSSDWKRLAGFYQEVFDCIPVLPERDLKGDWLSKATGVKNAELKGIHLKLPGFGENGPTLEIFSYKNMDGKPEASASRKGFGHIAFHVDDVKEIMEKVEKNGGSSLGEFVTKEYEGVGLLTVIYMKDPEGNIIEIQNWS